MYPTTAAAERAYLVGAQVKGSAGPWRLRDSLAELAQLAVTAGVEVIGWQEQHLSAINPATYIGKGKVEELKQIAEDQGLDVVIFDDELSPNQQRNLENRLGLKVIDRTALILDIFARHAKTREGALQVELAQYEYLLPRLTRAWTHLARQAGGGAARGGAAGVGLRGPGETQLETDRRVIDRRITQLKHQLELVRSHREQHRKHRRRQLAPVVSLVGYTNAGKSTLLNALTEAQVLATKRLFATLDPVTRRLELPGGKDVLLTDTVGFIQKLPTQLVAAFQATLEEIVDADLLLHVVDITHARVREQVQTVGRVLAEIGADRKPVLVALNKVDLLDDPDQARAVLTDYPDAVAVSALTAYGLADLLETIEQALARRMVNILARLPYAESELLAMLHRYGIVEQEEHEASGVLVRGRVPPAVATHFERYRVRPSGTREAGAS